MKINPFSKLIAELKAASHLPLTDTNNHRNYPLHKPHIRDKKIQAKTKYKNLIPPKYLRHS